ncbi:MAG: acetylxylan esterase [Bacteroidales bacterium]|nr:acetylxylan esterase [Bacteroidales bacterium]
MKRSVLLLYSILIPCVISAQFARQNQDSIRKLTQQDYKNMLDQLKITSVRPGPSGTPTAPNAANTDESKATQYTSLPDPLILNNGKRVTSARVWWKKRHPEIVELFDREVYGRVPANVPGVTWEVLSVTSDTVGKIPVIMKKLSGHVDNSAYPSIKVNIDLTLATPAGAIGPVPVIMEFGFVFPAGMRAMPANRPQTANTRPQGPAGPTWQQQVLEAGWAYAILVPGSIQADNGAGLRSGIIGLVNKGGSRMPDEWGSLRAWAWGASRALDYFETDKAVDASKVGIEGMSRYGKAAIVTMAYDDRFAIGFIGSSGAGGVKLYRRIFGEQVENLAGSGEYHWFAGNFIKYAADPRTQKDIPVDAHELVAICAPRPVFISSGSPTNGDAWVDGKGMFLAGAYASPVYELLGKKGMGTTEMPPVEKALVYGDVAYRMHSGGHTSGPNWPIFIEFAKRYLGKHDVVKK